MLLLKHLLNGVCLLFISMLRDTFITCVSRERQRRVYVFKIQCGQERTKALGYLTANEQQTNVAVPTSDSLSTGRPMNNVNELHIKITRASKLKARRTGCVSVATH